MKQSKKVQVRSVSAQSWDTARLKREIKNWQKKRILVIGDVGVDRYTTGSVERISPEAPVPIVRVEREELKLGLAANVADNVRALGGAPILVGVVGKDRGAQDFDRLLEEQRISSKQLIRDSSRRTIFKERIVSGRQHLLRVDYEDVTMPTARVWEELRAMIVQELKKCDGVILQDYAKGLVSEAIAKFLFESAAAANVPVFVDPNRRSPVDLYRGATLLTPNAKEAEALSGIRIQDQATLLEAGARILKSTGAESLILTRGKDGMAVFRAAERTVRLIPTYAREVYDVSGAGDTVISVVALALVSGATLEEAATLGNLAAGVEVEKWGTATVSTDEILEMMKWARATRKKVSTSVTSGR